MRHWLTASLGVAFLLTAPPSMGSEEEFLPWKTLRLECVGDQETGKVAVSADAGDAGLTALTVTAFGKNYALAAKDLDRIRGYPLDSLRVTHEVGYARLGGHTVHFRFSRPYSVPAEKKAGVEAVVVSVSKGRGLAVSGPYGR